MVRKLTCCLALIGGCLFVSAGSITATPPLSVPVDSALPRAQFDIPLENLTSAGTISIEWKVGEEQTGDSELLFELQQSQDEDFGTVLILYRGPDLASFISGLPDGDFYYRVRALSPDTLRAGVWSPAARVRVVHHPLSLALTLAGLGGFVFLATVGVIVIGSRRGDGEIAEPKDNR